MYENDRQVDWKDIARGVIDAERPRVSLRVEELPGTIGSGWGW